MAEKNLHWKLHLEKTRDSHERGSTDYRLQCCI